MRINKLINYIRIYFRENIDPEFDLILHSRNHNSSCFRINGTFYAIKKKKKVNVLRWFKKFWLFLEITFETELKINGNKTEPQINTKISLSVFQGDDSDIRKCQLFRAEWDDYNSEEKHSQPHWHITSSQALEKTLEEYADVFDEPEFLKEFEKEKEKVFDVKKIHFTMNGNWQNKGKHVHKIENEQQVVKWLQGMLNYLETELGGEITHL
jgi:hypothetical protein